MPRWARLGFPSTADEATPQRAGAHGAKRPGHMCPAPCQAPKTNCCGHSAGHPPLCHLVILGTLFPSGSLGRVSDQNKHERGCGKIAILDTCAWERLLPATLLLLFQFTATMLKCPHRDGRQRGGAGSVRRWERVSTVPRHLSPFPPRQRV